MIGIKVAGCGMAVFICVGAVQAVTGFLDTDKNSVSSAYANTGATAGKASSYDCKDTSYKIPADRMYPANGRRGSHRYVASKEAAPKEKIDCWIGQAIKVMEEQGIPGTYEGIWHILMNESGGKMNVCNDWDINAQAGTPSCGFMQVILPTFKANHCDGTSWELTDPVANICSASLYASRRYKNRGGIDGAPTPY